MGHEIRAADARRIETPILRARTRLEPCLGERRRRVLEDARADKRRGDPDRVQRRNERKMKGGNGRDDERRGRRLMMCAGADQRHRAFMPGRVCVGMEELVPVRQNAQRESGEQRCASPARDGSAKERDRRRLKLALHWRTPSPECAPRARAFPACLALGFHFGASGGKLRRVKIFLAAVFLVLGAAVLRSQEAELAPIVVTGTFELRQGPSVTDLFALHLLKQMETKRTMEEAVTRAPWFNARFWNYLPPLQSSSTDSYQFFTPSYLTSDYRNTARTLEESRKQSLFDAR